MAKAYSAQGTQKGEREPAPRYGSTSWLMEQTAAMAALVVALHDAAEEHPEASEELIDLARQLQDLIQGAESPSGRGVAASPARSGKASANSGSPANSDSSEMIQRLGALEVAVRALQADSATFRTDLVQLKTDVAMLKADISAIRSNYATKEYVADQIASLTWKIFSAVGLLTGAVFFIARHVN